MKPNRISKARAVSRLTYTAPLCGHIKRAFDTTGVGNSLVEVPFIQLEGGSIKLKREPHSTVWVEHVDMTINPKPEKASGLGSLDPLYTGTQTNDSLDGTTHLKSLAFYSGALYEGQISSGVLGGDVKHSAIEVPSEDGGAADTLRKYGIQAKADPRLDEIIALLKQLVNGQERAEHDRHGMAPGGFKAVKA